MDIRVSGHQVDTGDALPGEADRVLAATGGVALAVALVAAPRICSGDI